MFSFCSRLCDIYEASLIFVIQPPKSKAEQMWISDPRRPLAKKIRPMAKIIEISRWKETTARDNEPAIVCAEPNIAQSFHYWRGATGERYLHSVYSLFACPELPRANYILVHRNDEGERTVLAVGQTTEHAASLNLAYLRHSGARLGANEIHIHLLADTAQDRDSVEADLLPLSPGAHVAYGSKPSALAV